MLKKSVERILSIVLTLALTFGYYVSASAATFKTYYVTTTGNDNNIGTAAAPFRTLGKGVSVLLPGDTLIVSGKFSQTLAIGKSGTSSARINIIGKSAVLNMAGARDNGIKVTGSFINISGFEVTRTNSHAVLIAGKQINVENLVVHHNVLNNGAGPCIGGDSGWASAIKVMVGAANIVVRGNKVYENCGEGIAITRGVNTLVEKNSVRDNFSVNIYLDNSPYTTARSNNISCTGIYLRDGRRPMGVALGEEYYSGWGLQRHHNYVQNNTISDCYDGVVSWPSEKDGGMLADSVISGNSIITGTHRGITISSVNQNSLVETNTIFNTIYVKYPAGLTIRNNAIVSADAQPTPVTQSAITSAPTSLSETQSTSLLAADQSNPGMVIDDQDAAFTYSGDWQSTNGSLAGSGSYRSSAQVGASVTMTFVGQSFSVLYTDGPSFGGMSVFVDGSPAGTVAAVAPAPSFQQRWDFSGRLEQGMHTVQLVFDNAGGTFDGVILR